MLVLACGAAVNGAVTFLAFRGGEGGRSSASARQLPVGRCERWRHAGRVPRASASERVLHFTAVGPINIDVADAAAHVQCPCMLA